MGGYIFINEAINNAINNYNLLKDTPSKAEFNTFDIMVIKVLMWLYGEDEINHTFKSMNEHGLDGFDTVVCKYGYTEKQLHDFKNNFQSCYEVEKENDRLAYKMKNIYMDIVQKNLIDMYFLKRKSLNYGENEDKIMFDYLFTVNNNDFYKQTYSLLMSEDPTEITFYFKSKLFKIYNKYDFNIYKFNLLDMRIYDFFSLSEDVVNSFSQQQINSVNKQLFDFFQIEEDDEDKLIKINTAINNTRKKPKIDIIY